MATQMNTAAARAEAPYVEAVWSLYLSEPAIIAVLKKRKHRDALQKTGACVWVDEEGGCVRVVVAGGASSVSYARTFVEEIVSIYAARADAEENPWIAPVDEPATGFDDDLVHFTQQIPLALMGLVIGVKGASIHAIENMSACHLSLDRSVVYNDTSSGVPFVLLHVHGPRGGAMVAVEMCSSILARHLASSMEAEKTSPSLKIKVSSGDADKDSYQRTPTAVGSYDFDAYAQEA